MRGTRVRFEFSLFVPGIRVPIYRKGADGKSHAVGLGSPKPFGKGSIEPQKGKNGNVMKRASGARVIGDKKEAYEWVNKIAAHTLQKRNRLIAAGYDPFPYRGPVKVKALFVYERPHTMPMGDPIMETGAYAQSDLDKLQRALGDALTPTRDLRWPMGDVLAGDNYITWWSDVRKKFTDQIDWHGVTPAAGVYFRLEEDHEAPIDIREYL